MRSLTARSKEIRRTLARGLLMALALVAFVFAPFLLLVRGSVMAYRIWGLGTGIGVSTAVLATALLVPAAAWLTGRMGGTPHRARRRMTAGVIGTVGLLIVYGCVYFAGARAGPVRVREEFDASHPLLRLASSAVFLADPDIVMTDVGGAPTDYWMMGLPESEAALHFEQPDGYVHALDLRMGGRAEWQNKTIELGLWALGLHTRRLRGTADHLHVSLRLPEAG